MKTSIVIPNYNTGKYLGQCFESILKQTHKNYEIILVDGYSTDNTGNVVNEYKKQFGSKLHIVFRRPQGQSDAINVGMSMTHGKIVTYICADDTYEPNCFATISKVFKGNPEVEWIYGKGKIINVANKETRATITEFKELLQPTCSYLALQCVDYIVQPTVFMRKELYDKVGQFNTDIKYVVDYDYFLRTALISKPMFVNQHLANWRTHEDTFTDKNYKEKARESLKVSMQYSSILLRPFQWLVYLVTIIIYSRK